MRRCGRFGIPFDIICGPDRPEGVPLPEALTPAVVVAGLDDAAPRATAPVPTS